MRLVQVCNVGQIVGGTAACAWTVTRALPEWEHIVLFLSRVTEETRKAFDPCTVREIRRLTAEALQAEHPDLVLYHNLSASRGLEQWPGLAINYLHSKIEPARADGYLACSEWLAKKLPRIQPAVCYQGVPLAKRPEFPRSTRELREAPIVGRLCSPQAKKWPEKTAELYQQLAQRFDKVWWEFVGCPDDMQPRLREVCGGRAEFHLAGWEARSRFWEWDVLLYHNPDLTESFGRTVAEAMRAGCIPVVDRRGGFCEQVGEGGGFLCDTENDFATALAILQAPGQRLRRSRTCQHHANQRFSLATFRQSLLKCFEEVSTQRAEIV